MRVLFAGNLRHRGYADIGYNPDRKFYAGLIQNGYTVWDYSDRDIAHLDNPLGLKPIGKKLANKRFIETCLNFEPDLIVLSLVDILKNETIAEIRQLLPNVRVVHWTVDALFFEEAVAKLHHRLEVCDAIFATTGGERLKALAGNGKMAAHLPNLTEAGAETLDNSKKTDFDYDLIYFGVGNPSDPRWQLVGELSSQTMPFRFETFGTHGKPKVFGRARDKVLSQTRMALNLNRIEGDELYSSDRISFLIPNGIVTFISAQSGLQRFLRNDIDAVYFNSAEDILAKTNALLANDEKRQSIARSGRETYRRLFNAKRVTAFLVETAMGLPHTEAYEWADEVYR